MYTLNKYLDALTTTVPTMTLPSDSDAVLTIEFPTCFLYDLQLSGPAVALKQFNEDARVHRSNKVAPYTHLAMMLNLGGPKATEVAVTGCVDVENGVNATIVVSSNSLKKGPANGHGTHSLPNPRRQFSRQDP